MSLKAVFLYVGKAQSGNGDYSAYSVSDINLFSNANCFVLCPSSSPSTYGPLGDSNRRWPHLVSSIRTLVNTIKSSNKSSAQIYIGTPAVDGNSGNFQNPNMYSAIVNYLNDLRTSLGTHWSSITGIYMNGESVWGPVDYGNLFANPTIKLYNDLSYTIRTSFVKKFLWVPYYTVKEATAVTNIRNLGNVANRTNIFDYILIQPQYYFLGHNGVEAPLANIEGVYQSIQKEAVTYRDGVIVTPKRASATAQIGVQMEIDGNAIVDSGFNSRYNAYVSRYSSLVNSRTISFYKGAKGDASRPINNYFYDVVTRVNNFYA